jgi:putative PEP-CTERM system histidine kinase
MTLSLAAGAVWLVLALGALALGVSRRPAMSFAVAALLQAGWAASGWLGVQGTMASGIFEIGRTVAWSLFFASLLPWMRASAWSVLLVTGLGLVVLRVAMPAFTMLPALTRLQGLLLIDLLGVVAALCLAIAVFRAAGESSRWSLKFLCFPLAGLFVYDLYIYGQALSVGVPSQGYLAARGVIALIGAPFVGVALWRGRLWRQGLQVSRQAALYSLALVTVGLYLIGVAGVTVLARHWAIELTPALRVGALFATALLLVILLTSGRFRAKLKLLVSRHLFANKYDYAHEWRKFMQTLAFEGAASPLENRIIRACADVLEVPGGALWVTAGERAYLAATWHHRPGASVCDLDLEALFADRDGRYAIRAGDDLRAAGFPEADDPAWLAVPLPHNGGLLGFLVLPPPRVTHTVDDEDRELLMLIAHQCASHLAEKRAVTELQTEKQFSRFNRQYAFVAHDIKNLVSQLAVMLKNFDRHAANPEFQQDLRETVAHVVTRMRGLLDRLSRLQNQTPDTDGDAPRVAVSGVLRDVLAGDDGGGTATLGVTSAAEAAMARVPPERLADVVGHLLANAREAVGETGSVAVHLDVAQGRLVLDVTDDGPGMSPDFVQETLFTPFRSTKPGGFGVGVYQCREFAREHGGDLEVVSSPGSGTTMRLWLPVAASTTESDNETHGDDGAHFDALPDAAAGR